MDQLLRNGGVLTEDEFPSSDIIDRLDAGLFGARWNRTSDKQRAFLRVLATRPLDGPFDFSAKEIAHISPYTNGQASQMLQALAERGLVYRSRHGRYAFTVPMSESMILGRLQSQSDIEESWLSGATSGEDVVVEETGAKKRRRWSWFG